MKRVAITIAFVLLAAVLTPPLAAQTEAYDIIIRNGRIVDGSGNPWFYGDVAIRGDRIVKVGRVGPAQTKRQIDARGLIVAPGFIDMLGQSEQSLLIDPRAESKVFQGITTEVTGEGGSAAISSSVFQSVIEITPTSNSFEKMSASPRVRGED